MTSSNRNIIRVTGPLCGEFTGHRLSLIWRQCNGVMVKNDHVMEGLHCMIIREEYCRINTHESIDLPMLCCLICRNYMRELIPITTINEKCISNEFSNVFWLQSASSKSKELTASLTSKSYMCCYKIMVVFVDSVLLCLLWLHYPFSWIHKINETMLFRAIYWHCGNCVIVPRVPFTNMV